MLYERKLAGMDAELVMRAIDKLVDTERFMPSVAQIRATVDELRKRAVAMADMQRQIEDDKRVRPKQLGANRERIAGLFEAIGKTPPRIVDPRMIICQEEPPSCQKQRPTPENWGQRMPRTAEELDAALEKS